ncbi:MAG TPA: DUF4446 family protein [Candidatus Saccharimonadia bacterium]
MILLVLVIAVLALIIGALALRSQYALKRRFNDVLGGTETGSLEHTLTAHMNRVSEVDHRLGELESEYKRLAVTNSLASQKISIVRFNPFGDTGGDQSFSLAVLDAHDSGYVLTSIHGRQGTRVYVKPVDYGKSKYTLSAEEQQALSQAAKRVPQID